MLLTINELCVKSTPMNTETITMKHTKSEAALIREACRRAARAYCPMYKAVLLAPCYKCPLLKGGLDCHGNSIGTRDAKIAQARAAFLNLPSVTGHERKNGT